MKKKFELLGSLGQLEKCVAAGKLLLEKKDKETTKIVVKILSPSFAQLDYSTLILVIHYIHIEKRILLEAH